MVYSYVYEEWLWLDVKFFPMTMRNSSENDHMRVDSPSQGKVPKWLEDMSNNVKQKRPGSWRLSQRENVEESMPNSPTFSTECAKSSNTGLISLFNDFSLDRRSSRGSDILSSHREGSARHGRRAVPTTDTNSSESSPYESLQLNSGSNDHSYLIDTPEYLGSGKITPVSADGEPSISNAHIISKPDYNFVPETNEQAKGDKHSLEESWNSLTFFNKRHKGRLSKKNENTLPSPTPHSNCGQQNNTLSSAASSSCVSDFIIPELPSGQHLYFNIKSTWGDKHYLGLNGIEIFSSTGEPADVKEIWADPADINVLPEYSKDPRVVENLLDGVNRTHDDMHLWLAPFTPGANHFIHIVFQRRISLAMIRIWNYNKSRIHSFRGVRDVEISLDGTKIFTGEIARTCGSILGGTDTFGDTILFTTDENILEAMSHFDHSFSNTWRQENIEKSEVERPITADFGGDRPFTCAGSVCSKSPDENNILLGGQKLEITILENWGDGEFVGLTGFEIIGDTGLPIPIDPHHLHCSISSPDVYRLIDGVNLTTNEQHMWVTRFIDFQPIILTILLPKLHYIAALRLWNYNGLQDLTYCGVKILALHLDGKLLCSNATIRRAPGNCHFNFVQELPLTGKGKLSHSSDIQTQDEQTTFPYERTSSQYPQREDSQRTKGISMQRLPSKDEFDHQGVRNLAHFSSLSQSAESLNSKGSNEEFTRPQSVPLQNSISVPFDPVYEAPLMPQGFIFQILIFSTWGDMYYVGLNGLELYDQGGCRIKLTENNIGAFPESVNLLEGMDNDVRTPDKLVDGVNDTYDGRHMWLAPVLPDQLNRIYIVFDCPVKVSMIKLWNYAKTPNRGVKEFGILVDDLVVYNGVIEKIPSQNDDTDQKVQAKVPYCTIYFSHDETLYSLRTANKSENTPKPQLDCQRRVTSGSDSCYSADQSLRPFTSLIPN